MVTLTDRVRSRYSPGEVFALWGAARDQGSAERFSADVAVRWESAAQVLLDHLTGLARPATDDRVPAEPAPASRELDVSPASPQPDRGRRAREAPSAAGHVDEKVERRSQITRGSRSRRRVERAMPPDAFRSRREAGASSVSNREPAGSLRALIPGALAPAEPALPETSTPARSRSEACQPDLRALAGDMSRRAAALDLPLPQTPARWAAGEEIRGRAPFGVDALFDPLDPASRSLSSLQGETVDRDPAPPAPLQEAWVEERARENREARDETISVPEPPRRALPGWIEATSEALLCEMVRAAAREMLRSDEALREWRRTQF